MLTFVLRSPLSDDTFLRFHAELVAYFQLAPEATQSVSLDSQSTEYSVDDAVQLLLPSRDEYIDSNLL